MIIPNEGEIGKFKMTMFRGTKSTQIHVEFKSDPGDYGRGEYWTNSKEFAELYGTVEEKTIELENVYFIPRNELISSIEKYKTCKMHLGKEVRLKGSQELTDYYRNQKKCNAILTYDYESFDIYGLCIFN